MKPLLLDTQFWAAITGLAWPAVVLIIAVLFRRIIGKLLTRETLTIKVAGMELTVKEAAEQTGKGLSDIQERLAVLERNFSQPVGSGAVASRARSILWVDDFPSNNAFIIEKLERDGATIRKELSTDSAIGLLSRQSFDCIISDLVRIENGRENIHAGLEFTQALRASGNKTPLLIFAGRRGLENRDRLLVAGADQVTSSSVDVFRFVEENAPARRDPAPPG